MITKGGGFGYLRSVIPVIEFTEVNRLLRAGFAADVDLTDILAAGRRRSGQAQDYGVPGSIFRLLEVAANIGQGVGVCFAVDLFWHWTSAEQVEHQLVGAGVNLSAGREGIRHPPSFPTGLRTARPDADWP